MSAIATLTVSLLVSGRPLPEELLRLAVHAAHCRLQVSHIHTVRADPTQAQMCPLTDPLSQLHIPASASEQLQSLNKIYICICVLCPRSKLAFAQGTPSDSIAFINAFKVSKVTLCAGATCLPAGCRFFFCLFVLTRLPFPVCL